MEVEGRGQTASGASRFFSIAMIAVLLVGFITAAVRADGNHATQVDLNDAGIWLANANDHEIGRLNSELKLVDAKLNVGSPDFDLLQWGDTVLVRADDRLLSIDVRIPQSRGQVDLPSGSQLVLGGDTAAVYNPADGALWLGDGITVGTTKYDETEPTMTLSDAEEVLVGVDGAVYSLYRSVGVVSRLEAGAEEQQVMNVGEVSDLATATVVGSQPVLLDGSSVLFNDSKVDLSAYGETLLLQDPGPDVPGVVVATETQVVRVDFQTAFVDVLTDAGTGAPITPVVVNGCAYGAWQSSPTVAEYCGDGAVSVHVVPQTADDTPLRFRVNHNKVALNILPNGAAMLFDGGQPSFVTDWSQALHDEQDGSGDQTSQLDDKVEALRPVCDRTKNVPPDASDDRVVTRVGRPVVIRPLSNDSDANCDVLTIQLGELPEGIGNVDLIESGRAIQYTPADGIVNGVSIPYQAFDGIETDAAVITVEFETADSQGSPPVAVEDRTFVAQGRTVTHNVLLNDHDPDGDSLAVESVGEPDRGGSVRFRPDGQVVYTAPGDITGDVRIPYVVVDETGLTGNGVLIVQVNPSATNTLPIARSDHAAGFVGDEITVDVLANDSDADGDKLTIVSIKPNDGVAIDHSAGTVTLVADEPGVYSYVYEISDGRSSETVEGSLRIDVLERSGENQAPVAVRDDVVAVPGVPIVVDVLANDFEPDGDVIVLRSVQDVPGELTVEILNRSLLRITVNSSDVSDTYEFRYEISDGFHSATGLVVVRAVLVGGDNQPPVLTADSAEVHAGGAITIPVLENDYDPDGDVLVLEGAEVREPQGVGYFVVRDEKLRFLAPVDFTGTVTGTYTVFDGSDRVSETVKIRVKEASAENNLAPRPPDIEARTFSGQEVRIPLPLDLMDPDGDPVEILGVGPDAVDLPRLGQVSRITAGAIYYKPFEGSEGTDRFRYRVRDSFGAEGTGLIEVGIVPLPDVNGPPVAVGDEYSLPPGATVTLRPLLNDSDPEGSPLTIIEDGFTPPARGSAEVTADGQGIAFTSPPSEDLIIFGYTIADPAGARDSATIEVKVSDTVVNAPPVAVDDALDPMPAGSQVVVPVLDNDIDPDGDVAALQVAVIGFDDAVVAADGSVSFTMPDRGVSFVYTLTDPLDPSLTSAAFVQVPLATNRPPVVQFLEIQAGYNETQKVNVLGLASDPDGDEVSIVPDSIVVTRQSGVTTLDNGVITFDPDDRFSGQGGFTYRVTDGELETVGAVSIVVAGSGNETPSFRTMSVEVPAAGERTFDLERNVVDPDDDSHRFYELDRSALSAGIDVTLSEDGILRLASPDPTSKGQGGRISFTVDDGKELGVASGEVIVSVIASDKPMPEARPDTPDTDPRLGDIRQGQTDIELNVLDNDFDPFQDGSLVITSYGPVVPSDAGYLPPPNDARTILFTPNEGFFGTATISYSIQDATADPDRSSSSTVTLKIKDLPGASPSITGIPESRQVTLQWEPADSRGGTIDHYEAVFADTETPACESVSTICTVTGLENGTSYRFKVRAVTEVGPGPWSEPTPELRPNEAPDAPNVPTVEFGDQQLTVRWEKPNNEGSPILNYEVRIYPSQRTQIVGANTSELPWTGLTNGDNYWFDVRAINQDFESEWSGTSLPETPTGIPLSVPAPDAPQGGDRVVTVSWDPPFNENGGSILAYELEVFRDGSLVDTVHINDPGNRSYTVQGATNGSRYSFAVRAQNRAGWSDWSARSVETVPSGVPLGVATTYAQPGSSVVIWSPPDDNGAAITEYQVALKRDPALPIEVNWLGGFSSSTGSVDILYLSGTQPTPGRNSTFGSGRATSTDVATTRARWPLSTTAGHPRSRSSPPCRIGRLAGPGR